MQTNTKLYKSQQDKALFGVCGGIAEYFKVDSLIVRLLFVLFTFMYGSGLLFYIIAALVIPTAPSPYTSNNAMERAPENPIPATDDSSAPVQYIAQDGTKYESRAAAPAQSAGQTTRLPSENPPTKATVHHSGKTIGFALIGLGALIIIQVFLPWIDRRLIVAICLIFAGVVFLSKKPK